MAHVWTCRICRVLFLIAALIVIYGDAKQTKKKSKVAGTGVAKKRLTTEGHVLEGPEAMSLTKAEKEKLVGLDPQNLFSASSLACDSQELVKCYVGFSLFRERFPELVEGYSNAGVALERMGRLEDAKSLYRKALQKFPDSEKAIGPMLNVLQLEAVQAYDSGNLPVAYDRYKEIVKIAAEIPDAFINLGNIQEGLMDFDGAKSSYEKAIEIDRKNVKPYNSLCRLMLMQVSGHGAGRFGVTSIQRVKAFEQAQIYCSEAVSVASDDKAANMNLGMMYKESLEFDLAIHHLQKAKEMDPSDKIVLTNLATTLSRNNQVPEAVKILDKIIKIDPSPSTLYSLGTIIAPYDRLSKKGIKGHFEGLRKAVSSVPIGINHLCQHNLNSRKLRLDWLSADDVEIDIIEMIDVENSRFSLRAPRTFHDVDLGKTEIGEIPLSFIDKQTIAITIKDVYIEGAGAAMYTDCEVMSDLGLSTELARDYKGSANETVSIDLPVISILHSSISNYYHWTAESATRLILSLDYYFGVNGVAKDARLLLPDPTEFHFPQEFIDTFDIKLKFEPIYYQPGPHKRYKFRELHRIDWIQLDIDDPEQHDLWSSYLPSKFALQKLRDFAATKQDSKRLFSKLVKGIRPSIVYLTRAGVRSVKDEYILLDMMKEEFGDYFAVHDASKMTMDGVKVTKLQAQLDLIRHAQILIGPHGAGLTNMIYAHANVSVVEFPMSPHCNRCFGHMAAALEIDYWVVPEVTCFYHLKYSMTKGKAVATLQVVKEIVREKGLSLQGKGKIEQKSEL